MINFSISTLGNVNLKAKYELQGDGLDSVLTMAFDDCCKSIAKKWNYGSIKSFMELANDEFKKLNKILDINYNEFIINDAKIIAYNSKPYIYLTLISDGDDGHIITIGLSFYNYTNENYIINDDRFITY